MILIIADVSNICTYSDDIQYHIVVVKKEQIGDMCINHTK
jgi:hypothetical protein